MKLGKSARGLSTLYGASLLVSFGHGMTIPTIPLMVEYFDVSLFWGAQIITAYGIGALVGTPPAGIVADKFGVRITLIMGPVLIVGAALAVVLAPWFWLVLLAMVFAGAGNSTWMIGREIAGVDMVNSDQRGRMMSGFMGTNSAGMALGPALGGVLADSIDFRAVFLGFMIAGVIVFVLGFFAPVKSRAESAKPLRSSTGPRMPVWSLQRIAAIPGLVREIEPHLRATYGVLVFTTFTMMLYRTVLQSMLPLYVVIYRGYSATDLGFLMSIQGIFAIVMIVPAGFVTDKLGRKWATVPGTGIPAISFILLPFATDFVQIGGLLLLLGFANGLTLGAVATSTYDVIPAHARGRLQALRRTTSEVGAVTGPLAGGPIATLLNPGAPFLFAAPILVAASLLLAFVAKETLVRKPREPAAAGPP